jgi:hypothetical protein
MNDKTFLKTIQGFTARRAVFRARQRRHGIQRRSMRRASSRCGGRAGERTMRSTQGEHCRSGAEVDWRHSSRNLAWRNRLLGARQASSSLNSVIKPRTSETQEVTRIWMETRTRPSSTLLSESHAPSSATSRGGDWGLLSDGKAHHQRNRHIDVDRHTNILVSLSHLLYQVGAFHNLQGEAFSSIPGTWLARSVSHSLSTTRRKYTPRRT